VTRELSPSVGRTIREALHDVRSRLGAIRLAVTSLHDAPDDPAFAAALVGTADRESLRLGAELTAVSALVRALTDDEAPGVLDLSDALGAHGVTEPVGVAGPPEVLAAALEALARLAGETARATVTATQDDVRVRFEGPDADAAAGSAIARALIESVGEPEPGATLGVVLRRAP
jgi:hypothetical protein